MDFNEWVIYFKNIKTIITNKTLKKVIKGIIAIFTLKLVFLAGIFIFQSCSTDNQTIDSNQIAKNNFLASWKQSQDNLSSFSFNTKNSKENELMSRETQQATEIICLQFSEEFLNQNGEFDIDEIVDEISTVTELIQVKNQYALEIKPEHLNDNIGDNTDENTDETTEPNFNPEDCIAIIEIPSQPISDALNPAIQEAKNYLISSYGFSNQEINEMIEDENGKEEDLVPLVMAMTNAENSNNGIVFNYMSIFGESVYAQDWEQIGNCAMVAIGADVLYALATVNPAQGSKWKKKAIKKAFGAVAKRMLGPIGVAIAVVSFAMCMGGL